MASSLHSMNVSVAERVVKISDSEGFAVRGLSPMQVVSLYRRYAGQFEPLFQSVIAGAQAAGAGQRADIEAVVRSLLSEFPSILAELITFASGGNPSDSTPVTVIDPESREPVTLRSFDAALLIANYLPFPVQADALEKPCFSVAEYPLDTASDPRGCLGFRPPYRLKDAEHIIGADRGHWNITKRRRIFAKGHLPLCAMFRIAPRVAEVLDQCVSALPKGDLRRCLKNWLGRGRCSLGVAGRYRMDATRKRIAGRG